MYPINESLCSVLKHSTVPYPTTSTPSPVPCWRRGYRLHRSNQTRPSKQQVEAPQTKRGDCFSVHACRSSCSHGPTSGTGIPVSKSPPSRLIAVDVRSLPSEAMPRKAYHLFIHASEKIRKQFVTSEKGGEMAGCTKRNHLAGAGPAMCNQLQNHSPSHQHGRQSFHPIISFARPELSAPRTRSSTEPVVTRPQLRQPKAYPRSSLPVSSSVILQSCLPINAVRIVTQQRCTAQNRREDIQQLHSKTRQREAYNSHPQLLRLLLLRKARFYCADVTLHGVGIETRGAAECIPVSLRKG